MIVARASLILLALQAQPVSGEPISKPPGLKSQEATAPIAIEVTGVSAERTIAEFMDVCFRPMWNVQEVRDAAMRSDFKYSEEKHEEPYPTSFRWRSDRGYLALEVPLTGVHRQCALSVASVQPRTGKQILEMIKPAIEAELGHEAQVNEEQFYLQWDAPDPRLVRRITLALASDQPAQSLWYVFDEAPR
jgi:hypothetical protein